MANGPIYTLRPAEVYAALATSPDGLICGEVVARRGLYGENVLLEEAASKAWQRFLGHMVHPFAWLLWIAGGISFSAREPVLGVVIWILMVVNAGFSFWREHRTEQAMHALRQLLPSNARLVREGKEVSAPTNEIVPGDILILAEGDSIPADARIVEAFGLRINNAVLTGDAVPARKTADASLRQGISEIERTNLVFAGTSVVSGTGRAVVYSTGMLTQFGRIAHLTQVVEESPSPFQVELVRITHLIAIVALVLGVTVFVVGAFELGLDRYAAFLLALGIIVAAVPEGLPAMITLTLAMSGQRLAQRGVLVKKLSVIETLGTVSTICADKSGTLTQNQMTVREIWVSGRNLAVSGGGYEPVGRISPDLSNEPGEDDLDLLLRAAMLCNNSRLSPPSDLRPRWTALGDQTEAALRVVALKGQIDEDELTKVLPRVHELPFEARRKRMSTIHRIRQGARPDWIDRLVRSESEALDDRREVAFVKGAPREVLQLCKYILLEGEVRSLEDSLRAEIVAANDRHARRGLRVLALGFRFLPQRAGPYAPEGVECDLTFLGLMAMLDPARPEVAEAVRICKQAGIHIVMITGDYGLTAESLARRIGMLTTSEALIVTGAELDAMDDVELDSLLEKEVVFARMAPEHKLRLVTAFQRQGEIVAVTGDGVNDAPALRKADIGVAMGWTGTDVAKEAADIVLVNDNFATIVNAIEEGRAVYDNLRKFLTYIFSSNVPEVLP
ncbi:MAG TPA: cation-transporting P-type ATPase, partial [Anaerolineales bacterium]